MIAEPSGNPTGAAALVTYRNARATRHSAGIAGNPLDAASEACSLHREFANRMGVMLAAISPAKRLDLSPVARATTDPAFRREASILAGHVRQLTLKGLIELMDLSEGLARLNRDRFRAFDNAHAPANSRPAVFTFAGDTYLGLEAGSLDDDALLYAQDHLRILSGLYGVLRPLDAIQPHRLEMGSRLKTRRGRNLYEFWRDLPAKALNRAANAVGTGILVNCASQEYFRAVDMRTLTLRVIEPVFLDVKDGVPKTVSFFAKRARGSLARFIVERRVTDPDGLKDFDLGGYRFDLASSTENRIVFLRDEKARRSFQEKSLARASNELRHVPAV